MFSTCCDRRCRILGERIMRRASKETITNTLASRSRYGLQYSVFES
jgi:hypothetical protein